MRVIDEKLQQEILLQKKIVYLQKYQKRIVDFMVRNICLCTYDLLRLQEESNFILCTIEDLKTELKIINYEN